MMAALTLPAVEGESVREYEARLWEDSNAHSIEARDRGTEIHGYIEKYYLMAQKGLVTTDAPAMPYIIAVTEALKEAFGEQEWKPEKSFASPLGFGGKIDLHSGAVIVDYKTKETSKITPKKAMAYAEDKMQLSAYRKGLELPEAKIANLYIGRELVDGKAVVKLEVHDDDHWPHFDCLLNYWKLIKGIA